MKITKLVIDENRWLRAGWRGGLDPDYSSADKYGYLPKHLTAASSLLDKKTKRMCCLGFASCAAGVSKKDIMNIGSPAGIKLKEKAKIAKKFPWLLSPSSRTSPSSIDLGTMDSQIAGDLMQINDNPKISLPNKRAKITKIFKQNGVEVIFKR